ncbi:hypothetical protein [Pedobacter glucosidilyticus]|uniref:hypothetical protein n=1 Tax=Pedobacter glucosidilyticus TaxID=1122941 RepID=UPI0026F0D7C1|nr:hypothetical protein [Pedobacter glucosidilyticus]
MDNQLVLEKRVDLLKQKLLSHLLVDTKSSIESFSYYLSVTNDIENKDFLYHLNAFLDTSYNTINSIEGLGYLLNHQHKEKQLIHLKSYINQIISQLDYLQPEKVIINEVDDQVTFLSLEPILFYVLKTILRNCILNHKHGSLPLIISTSSDGMFLKIIIKNAFLLSKEVYSNVVAYDHQICELCLMSINGELCMLSDSLALDDIEIKLVSS